MQERKYYIDNLRWLAILLLFPFHASQIWSGGEYSGFYVWDHTNNIMYAFSTAVYPWYMTLLFTLAGMSSNYALQKRTNKQFIAERAKTPKFKRAFYRSFFYLLFTYIPLLFHHFQQRLQFLQ